MLNTKRRYSLGEEIFNCVVHGVGAGLAIAGAVVLIVLSAMDNDVWAVVANSVYGGMLILFFTISTVYHALSNFNARNVMRVFDSNLIFLLIAGTYTPFCLISMRGVSGWIVFGAIWALTALCIVFNSINNEKFSKIAPVCYVVLGWGALFATKPLLENNSKFTIMLLLIGGLIFTIGAIIYAMKKFKYAHSVWHVFIFLGCICHFFSILGIVA